ncbi:peptide-methionine (S)-S-oxide reductase MsrA [Gammaproteobacteria bacterium]|jgi:peptide-methionine (S)-S-oxide reductase|nr:peptide-methionine (S)-S-oxide reductase MsrA [Gammaproteobacteria bacterium]|tara:strand:- start:10445 stop:11002 length:558 start_codon:yes stop_codon:yes gene_type:complete
MNHYISNIDLNAELPEGYKSIILGAGCFWGVERKFWELSDVWLTSVGYAGGLSPNPTYEQVCYEETGHVEVVKVSYDSLKISLENILSKFWECHDPTQGNRQGNDRGTQYRSVIFCCDEDDLSLAKITQEKYQASLEAANFGKITTEIKIFNEYFLAEEYHQQYLAKNPNGYCGLGGTNCPFPNN